MSLRVCPPSPSELSHRVQLSHPTKFSLLLKNWRLPPPPLLLAKSRMATTKLALPHFLNLPLPPIPFEQASSSKSNTGSNSAATSQPLLFKLNLSPEQYDELLNLDAEVEEGEEGGLRVEFDPSGKAALHLNPTRILQLNPTRSGPSRTNRPEEIYRHTPTSTSSSSRSPLTGLFRIPTSTSVYDLQRPPPPSDLPIAPPPQTRSIEPTKPSNPKPSQHMPTNHNPPPSRPLRQTTESTRSEKEKLAGQKLKEKRLEDDRKKKEKQMVILPDVPPPAPANKRVRPTKLKPSTKQTSAPTNRQPASTAASHTSLSSRNQPIPPAPASQPLPPRRALPGSQSGKQLAHGLNQHLANPSASLSKFIPSHPAPEVPPPPPSQPLPAPAPPPVTFKPSSSNNRSKPPTPNPSLLTDPRSAPPSEPPSATKLRTTTRLTDLSEEGATDHRRQDTPSQPTKPPSPPVATLKPKESTSQLSKSSPRLGAGPNGVKSQSTLPEPNGSSSTHERTSSGASVHKRPVRKQAPLADSKTSDSPQVDRARSPTDSDVPNSSSKRQRPDTLTANPTPPLTRPKKSQRRDTNERRPSDNSPAPSTQSNDRSRSNNGVARTEDQPRRTGIVVKKIPVPVERSPVVGSNETATTSLPVNRKRALDPEPVLPVNPINKRVRQEEGGISLSGSGLPTIRKMVRAVPPAPVPVVAEAENGHVKKVKKKKKSFRNVDYTSSEAEEGEEPGEIISSSSKSRPSLPTKTSNYRPSPNEIEKVPPPRSVEPERTRDVPGRSQRAISPVQSSTKANTKQASRTQEEEEARVESSQESISKPSTKKPTDPDPDYDRLRLSYHQLLNHYHFVCDHIDQLQKDRQLCQNLLDVQDLICEVQGLEVELDRLAKQIALKYSASHSS
ncbi:hypothetical protein MJO29_016312 [Puccinia striiformis f. sp. tritici]|nr:hypothetical protein MJO29_016312 [Puccinia striiformis f. sp. tritici]KAI9600615.1 hypothetical protein H4Q26_000403 [Puccinia striiformis f. sp. tritici PST-130]